MCIARELHRNLHRGDGEEGKVVRGGRRREGEKRGGRGRETGRKWGREGAGRWGYTA